MCQLYWCIENDDISQSHIFLKKIKNIKKYDKNPSKHFLKWMQIWLQNCQKKPLNATSMSNK